MLNSKYLHFNRENGCTKVVLSRGQYTSEEHLSGCMLLSRNISSHIIDRNCMALLKKMPAVVLSAEIGTGECYALKKYYPSVAKF